MSDYWSEEVQSKLAADRQALTAELSAVVARAAMLDPYTRACLAHRLVDVVFPTTGDPWRLKVCEFILTGALQERGLIWSEDFGPWLLNEEGDAALKRDELDPLERHALERIAKGDRTVGSDLNVDPDEFWGPLT